MSNARRHRAGFTLIELLIVVAVVSLLIGLLLPGLAGARESARTAQCLSNQRQMVLAWSLYAAEHAGSVMPLANEQGPFPVYWWGALAPGGPGPAVAHERGFLMPYLDASLAEHSVLECPAQPWGTYRPQPAGLIPPQPTSTYGYNGYYLCLPSTPGWNLQVQGQRWKTLADIEQPTGLFVFGDTLLDGSPAQNCALLDPPELFASGAWIQNSSPTTAFRHGGRRSIGSAAAARADGSAGSYAARPEWLTSPGNRIGSVGMKNDPHYIPDWKRWR
jgi:prepilin-type N-terminal cleavage/methylation domain-containing protein